MKFAHFSHIWAKPGMTPHQRYEQLWRELEAVRRARLRSFVLRRASFPSRRELDVVAELYAVGAGARTKRLRIGPMGYIVPLYHPLRLAEEIAIVDQMLGGRMELGLVPGINPDYFRPFGLDYGQRKSPTLEFVDYLRAAFGDTQPFSFHGQDFHTDNARISVAPAQRPHPPLWMMSRDPQTLEFCARTRSIPAIFWSIRAPTRRRATGNFWPIGRRPAACEKPNIAYCTVVYVDDTDDKAIETALFRASRAYEGFLAPAKPGETFEERATRARQNVRRPRRARRLGDHAASVRWRLSVEERPRLHRLAAKRSPPKSAPPPKRACSTCSWASSISPTCRRTRCCARSGCSAKK